MPVDWDNYDAGWESLAEEIIRRDGRCCVACRVPQFSVGHRLDDGTFLLSEIGESYREARQLARELQALYGVRFIVISLAVHHECQTPRCTDERHLNAVCQYHHQIADKRHHRINAARTRARRISRAEDFF